jgi:hypothetical protein
MPDRNPTVLEGLMHSHRKKNKFKSNHTSSFLCFPLYFRKLNYSLHFKTIACLWILFKFRSVFGHKAKLEILKKSSRGIMLRLVKIIA